MAAGDVGLAVDGGRDSTVRWPMHDGRSGSSRIGLELQAGVGPTGFASSATG